MTTEYVIKPFLNAKGKMVKVGAKAPDESVDNLKQYRSLNLIGSEAVTEAITSKDVGRPGKAATRKKAKPAS